MCRGELPKIDRSSDSVRLGFDRKSKRRETRLRALCVPSHLGLGPGCKNKEKPMTVCNRRSRVFSLFLISQASVPITTIQFQVRCSATWALVAFAPRCARGSFCSLALVIKIPWKGQNPTGPGSPSDRSLGLTITDGPETCRHFCFARF